MRRDRWALALAALTAVGCHGASPAAPAPGPGVGSAPAGAKEPLAPEPGADEAPLEERIAAIEHAMNELAPVSQRCWAAAAAETLEVVGRIEAEIAIDREGHAVANLTLDEPRRPALTRCLVAVLTAYPWPPPLRGQVVDLPFAFRAPATQSVVDRRLVPHRGQAGLDVAVVLDRVNTANAAASLLEVRFAHPVESGPRAIERTELWWFRGPAKVTWAGGGGPRTLAAGDALRVPPGARLAIAAVDAATPVAAVVALVPGGSEGVARAGALPGAWADVTARGTFPQPVVAAAGAGARFTRPGGVATLRIEPGVPTRAVGGELSLLDLSLDAGAAVPRHTHDGATEVLYLLSGGGTMAVGDVELPVDEHSAITLPAGVPHAFTATAATTAIQLYTPAGPEQRFKPAKPGAR